MHSLGGRLPGLGRVLGLIRYGLAKMCLCHIRKRRSVIVPWTHIQPCPGHIYNRVLDTYTIVPWARSISVSLTHLNMSLPHLYMEKRQKYCHISSSYQIFKPQYRGNI